MDKPGQHLHYGEYRGYHHRQAQIGRDNEHHDENEAWQHRFHDATRAANRLDDGEIAVPGLSEGGDTGTRFAVLGRIRHRATQRTSENIGPRDKVVFCSTC